MAFDVEKIRGDFPVLSRVLPNGRQLAYLDNGATSQKPAAVINRLTKFYSEENANIHRGLHHLSAEATFNFENARTAIATYLKTPKDCDLIFTRGTTEAINLIAHGLASELNEGDEIVITLMEHHANFVPWQLLALKTGAKVRYANVKDNGELDLDDWKASFNSRTKVASFTQVSNALGTVNPAKEMAAFCRERNVISVVDGAQAVPHGPVDLGDLDCDFYAFSGHKVFGPDGVGVLVGNSEILNRFPPYQSGGDMIDRVAIEGTTFQKAPERFEAGTPNISATIGLAAAFQYLSELDWIGAHEHETALLTEATERLKAVGGIKIWGEAPVKASVISFTMDEAHPQDIATILDNVGVAIRTGHHCAMPLMTHFGIKGTARASFAFYNNRDDIDALIEGMGKVKRLFA
ncbi:MAG: SufS family cysteine desulfurase [Verrucomicrobiales bacterium]|nr:SufS family cysteine desulfurase [Verrucomicrobiales bacterium]